MNPTAPTTFANSDDWKGIVSRLKEDGYVLATTQNALDGRWSDAI